MADLLSNALNRLSQGFAVFDSDLRLVGCNSQFGELRGFPPELCQAGVSFHALVEYRARLGDFGDCDTAAEADKRCKALRDKPNRVLIHPLGSGRVLRIRYQGLPDDAILVTYEDVTDFTQSEKSLRESEERYALVSTATSEGHYDWNVGTDHLQISERLQEILELTDDTLDSHAWFDLVHPADQELYVAALTELFRGNTQRLDCQYRIQYGDGSYRRLRDAAVAVRDPSARVVRLVGAVEDITQKVAAADALRESEERYALVSEATSEGHYDWSLADDVLTVSDRLNEMFDFATGELSSQAWLSRIHPDDAETYRLALREHLRGNTPRVSCEYRIQDAHGDYRWVRDSAKGIRGADGRIYRFVGAISDVSVEKTATAALEAIRTRLSDSIDAISDGYLLTDANDNVVLWNARYVEIFGAAADGGIDDVMQVGRPYHDVLVAGYERGCFPPHPHGFEGWMADRFAIRQTGSSELDVYLSNDKWVRVCDQSMTDGGRVAVFSDITEVKRHEAEIEAARDVAQFAQRRFEDAIEAISAGFVLFDAEDRIVTANSRYRKWFAGLEDLVAPGTHFRDLVREGIHRGLFPLAADDPEGFLEALLEKRQAQGGVREQIIEGDVYLQVSDHRTSEGGIVSVYTDVTAIRQSEQRLTGILNNSPIGVGVISRDNSVLYHNPRFAEILGAADRDLIGLDTRTLVIDAERRAQVFEKFREKGILRDWETEYRGLDGRPVAVLTTWVTTEYEGEEARLTWIYDVSEAKRNREALEAAKRDAEQALEELKLTQDRLVQTEKLASLGHLTGGIAHEIKNPLNFVNNFAKLSNELLEELCEILEAPMKQLGEEAREEAEDLVETLQENLVRITEHGTRADGIVRNMLAHSREGPGEAASFDFNGMLHESMQLAYHGARAEDSSFNITLNEELDTAIGSFLGHRQELSRSFLNLITNGFHAATDRAKVEVNFNPELTLSAKVDNGDIRAVVADNGIGMTPEVLANIFTPFYTTKPPGEGTGLGLSLTHDIIVQQHGGTIEVESEPNRFTRFVVTLPMKS